MSLSDLPDVSFVEVNPEKILADIISDYENAYFESTGVRKTLQPADPIRIFLYTQALREIQLRHAIDEAAKQNLLKYSTRDNLDHLGSRRKTERGREKPSWTRMLLKFSQARPNIVVIPKGMRFSPGTNLYFAIEQTYELPAGEQEIIVLVACTEAGADSNGILPGQINVIVDPLPYLVEAENIDITQGGQDIEDDDSYRERIYLAPEGYSTAGPDGAYEYHTKAYSHLIEDVKVSTPSPGVVDVRVLLDDGELPSASFLEGLEGHFEKGLRPLTDKVQFDAPDVVNYDIDVTYYISNNKIGEVDQIRESVQKALDDYLKWQRSKIGRDVNDSELVFRLRQAGAKRIEIRFPSYKVINDIEVARAENISLIYGGLEDE